MKILFVCTGNTCRSPMAEALAFTIFKNSGLEIEVGSAGLSAMDGQDASPNAAAVMEKRGLSLAPHRARSVTADDLGTAELILTMTERHKHCLLIEYPQFEDRIFTLGEYVGVSEDIDDPYARDESIYEKCACELEIRIKKLAAIIGQLY